MTRRYFPLLILAGALIVTFQRLLSGEVFFWGLPSLQFYPWREYGFDLIRHGQLPLWNPYNGAGAPLLANYQSALLYPPNWFGLFLPLACISSSAGGGCGHSPSGSAFHCSVVESAHWRSA
jgi:hypothetical protein